MEYEPQLRPCKPTPACLDQSIMYALLRACICYNRGRPSCTVKAMHLGPDSADYTLRGGGKPSNRLKDTLWIIGDLGCSRVRPRNCKRQS